MNGKFATIVIIMMLILNLHAENLEIATSEWPPFEDISNKELPGFSTEVIREVCNELNIIPEIKEYPWARALMMVELGSVDATYSAFYTRERAEVCYYPQEPLFTDRWILFAKKDVIDTLLYKSYQELKDYRFAVMRGVSISEDFWKFLKDNNNYLETVKDEESFRALMLGTIDFVVTTYYNGMFLIAEMKLQGKVLPLSATIKVDSVYLIFSKRNTSVEFVERFSKQLKKFKESAEYKKIYRKYFKKLR